MRGAKQRAWDALVAVGVGLVLMAVAAILGYARSHGDVEVAGKAVGRPLIATLIVAVIVASWHERLRAREIGLFILLICGFLYVMR